MFVYFNNGFVTREEARVSVFDLGFSAGVQVVDNARTYGRKLFRWKDHVERFLHDCAYCQIPMLKTKHELTAIANELIARTPGVEELQVVMSATPGERWPNAMPTFMATVYPVPLEKYALFSSEGVKINTAGSLAAGPGWLVPSSVKHRSRLAWWLAEHHSPPGTIPILTADTNQHIYTETAIGNVALVVDGVVTFSDPDYVLKGITAQVTRELCESLNIPVKTALLTKDLVKIASEALLMGTGFGIAGVSMWDTRKFVWPGPVTRKLMYAWAEITH